MINIVDSLHCTINDFDSCIPFLDICSDESACNYIEIEDYYELSNFDENCVFIAIRLLRVPLIPQLPAYSTRDGLRG